MDEDDTLGQYFSSEDSQHHREDSSSLSSLFPDPLFYWHSTDVSIATTTNTTNTPSPPQISIESTGGGCGLRVKEEVEPVGLEDAGSGDSSSLPTPATPGVIIGSVRRKGRHRNYD